MFQSFFIGQAPPLLQNFPQQDFLSATPQEPTPPRPSRQFSAGFSSAERLPKNETRIKKTIVFTQFLGRHVFRATDIQTFRGASILKLFGRPDIQTFRGASIFKLFGRPDIQTFRAPGYPNFLGAPIFTFFGRPIFKLLGAHRSSNFSGAPTFKLFGAPRY